MQATEDPNSVETEKRHEFILLCNRAILAVLFFVNVVTGFIAYMGVCYGLGAGGNPSALIGLIPFAVSLTLTLGHKRLAREAPFSRFSRLFWPIASVHYFALIFAFFWYGISTAPVPVDRAAKPEHGIGYFLFFVAICTLPAILSLPPLIFTVREMIRMRRAGARLPDGAVR